MDGQGIDFIIGIIVLCVIPALPVLVSKHTKEN